MLKLNLYPVFAIRSDNRLPLLTAGVRLNHVSVVVLAGTGAEEEECPVHMRLRLAAMEEFTITSLTCVAYCRVFISIRWLTIGVTSYMSLII